jgi:hypothetical protein
MQIDLSGRTALVTGSSQGIGLAIATGLARAGADVVLTGRDDGRLQAAADGIGGRVTTVAGDVTTDDGTAALLDAVPSVDVLVNNLGIFGAQPALEIPDDEWRRYFETNVLTAVRLTRAYLPGMRDRGWGRIQYIASDSAVAIPAEMIHYGVTKTALLGVSRGNACGRCRLRGDGQFGDRRSDPHGRRRGLRALPRRRPSVGRGAAGVHAAAPAAVAAAAADRAGGDRQHVRLPRLAAGVRDDGCRGARRRRLRRRDPPVIPGRQR